MEKRKKNIKIKNLLNEAYMSGGNPLDPVLGPSIGSKNPAYVYKILQFNDSLQGQKQKNSHGIEYTNVGSYVEANNHHGEPIRGRIVKMDKDQDGYIVRVYILNEKNKRLTSVDVDSIKPIHFQDDSRNKNNRLNQMMTPSKFVLTESVKRNGPIRFKYKNIDHVATLNEGRVLIVKLFEGKAISATDIIDTPRDMDDTIMKKINETA